MINNHTTLIAAAVMVASCLLGFVVSGILSYWGL